LFSLSRTSRKSCDRAIHSRVGGLYRAIINRTARHDAIRTAEEGVGGRRRAKGGDRVAPFAFIAASVSRREKAARRRFRARASATIAATYAAPIAPHPRPPILPLSLPPFLPAPPSLRRSVGAPSRISYRSRPFFLSCPFPFLLPVFFFLYSS